MDGVASQSPLPQDGSGHFAGMDMGVVAPSQYAWDRTEVHPNNKQFKKISKCNVACFHVDGECSY